MTEVQFQVQPGSREAEALAKIENLLQMWPSLSSDSGWLRSTQYKGTDSETGMVHFLTTWCQPTKPEPVGKATAGIWFTYAEPNDTDSSKRENTDPATPTATLTYRFERRYRTHSVPVRTLGDSNSLSSYQPDIRSPDRHLTEIMQDKISVGQRLSGLISSRVNAKRTSIVPFSSEIPFRPASTDHNFKRQSPPTSTNLDTAGSLESKWASEVEDTEGKVVTWSDKEEVF